MGKDKSIEEYQEENATLKANLKTAFRELGRKLIESIQGLSMGVQKEKFESAFHRWKGEHDQVDDVLIIGVRV